MQGGLQDSSGLQVTSQPTIEKSDGLAYKSQSLSNKVMPSVLAQLELEP